MFPHLLETFVGADVFDTDINKNCVIMLMYSVVKNIKTIFCWEGILDFPLMRNDKNGPFRAIKSFRAHFYLKSKSIVLKFSAGSGISKNFFGFLNFGGILVSSPQKFYNIVHRSNFWRNILCHIFFFCLLFSVTEECRSRNDNLSLELQLVWSAFFLVIESTPRMQRHGYMQRPARQLRPMSSLFLLSTQMTVKANLQYYIPCLDPHFNHA